jgi:hypothetical protein
MATRPRILVVSYHAANPLTPRGARTLAVVRALCENVDVHLLSGSPPAAPRTWGDRLRDRALWEVGARWLLDPYEPWSWRVLRRDWTGLDGALLVGYPFSPVVAAAQGLRRQRIAYVVDASDPWALTQVLDARGFADRRRAEHERRLWASAAGGIVTTSGQAGALRALVPDLEILVRPNGYSLVDRSDRSQPRRVPGTLRIGHFGDLYGPRIKISGFLARLASSKLWERIVFHQYGRDHERQLVGLPGDLEVHMHDPMAWSLVVDRSSRELDVALVVGNKDPRQLPSKAIEYLTLPVPRLAVVGGTSQDALVDYVSDKRAWLTISVDDPTPARAVLAHVSRAWSAAELAAPTHESWAYVAPTLAEFVLRCCADARLTAVGTTP